MRISEEIRTELDSTEVISFDIFDTLLLRSVRKPYQVFDLAYEKAKECFPDYISARDWRAIRMNLPILAKRKKDASSVTLDDYLNEVPFFVSDTRRLRAAEIEAEKECAIINPDILEILLECKYKHNKRIVLVSDMYLCESDIREILIAAGMDMTVVDSIFVSVNYCARKSTGRLFSIVAEKLGCAPNHILHIGDNWESDYCAAIDAGWRAIYYSVISEAEYEYPFLPFESQLFRNGDCLGGSLYSLRCLSASHASESGTASKWFKMGAMTYGPLLTYTAEWVLDLAEQKGIKNVYPLMREGQFLSKLLQKEAAYRGWSGRIEPLYISRRALFPALLSVIESRDISYSFISNTGISRNLTVGEVLDMYHADPNEELYRFRDVQMLSARDIQIEETTVSQRMNEKYFSNIDETHIRCRDSDETIWEYFKSLDMNTEDFITLDFGYAGTTQNAIERLLFKRNSQGHGLHLLIVGKHTIQSRENFGCNTDIRGFASMLSDDKEYTDAINSSICDSLLQCRCGSVAGYKSDGIKVTPTFGKPDYNQETISLIESFQDGILEFQKVYHTICHSRQRRLKCNRNELLKMALRMVIFPTKAEAEELSSITSDNKRVVDYEQIEDYRRLGFEQFFRDRFQKGTARQWYQGMDAIVDGLKYYRESTMDVKINDEYLYALYSKYVSDRYIGFSIVGTPDEIRRVAWALHLLDAWNQVIELFTTDDKYAGRVMFGKQLLHMPTMDQIHGYYMLLTRDKSRIKSLREKLVNADGVIDFYE